MSHVEDRGEEMVGGYRGIGGRYLGGIVECQVEKSVRRNCLSVCVTVADLFSFFPYKYHINTRPGRLYRYLCPSLSCSPGRDR